MRAYRNLLARLAEDAPETIGRLPGQFLAAQARWLLENDEIYVLEQVNKHVPVLAGLPSGAVARAAERALDRGVVDDFCFLYAASAPGERPGTARIERACARLARRGNAGGIEQIIAATGVRPRFDEETVLRSYHVLVAAGRLGAVDYMRQLSGVPVRFGADAAAIGIRTLLASGRHGALRELARLADVEVHLDAREVSAAVEEAVGDGTLRELASALACLRPAPRVEGFGPVLGRLVSQQRFAEVPALFTVFADADWQALDAPLWQQLLTSGSAPAVRFAFERYDDAATLARQAPDACALGVSTGDRALVRLACERGGARLRADDVHLLLDDALEDGDASWVDFAAARFAVLPVADPDRVQLYLARLATRDPQRVTEHCEALGVAWDPELGRWLLGLAEGRPEGSGGNSGRAPAHPAGSEAGAASGSGRAPGHPAGSEADAASDWGQVPGHPVADAVSARVRGAGTATVRVAGVDAAHVARAETLRVAGAETAGAGVA